MRTVDAAPEVMEEFIREARSDKPIVMINLLRYREQAAYEPGFDAAPCSGREAYQRYADQVMKLIGKAGGRPLWMGHVNDAPIAPSDEAWDDAVLVYYPSRRHFVDMIESDEYQAAKPHRSAALEDSRLIEATTLFGPGTE